MNKVKKKFDDLEKKQKEISDKLDKYEYNFNKEQKKSRDIEDFTFKNNINNENVDDQPKVKIDKDYQKVLDRRLDEVMGKINDNIINQNYIDFYNFLLQGRPKYDKSKKQKQKINKKKDIEDSFKNNNNIIEDNQNKINKENEIDNINDNINENNNNEININNINVNNKLINIDNNTKYDNKENNIDNNLDNNKDAQLDINNNSNNNNNLNQLKLNNIPHKANLHISYNGTGKINLEDIQNKENLELLHKQQNIFLGNELTLLKCKLNKIRKENEFLQSLIHEKGMVKNTNVLEKFIGGFVEKLSLNWNEIVEKIIDEIIADEVYELNELYLNKVKYEKNKNILINNLFKAGIGGIIPEKSEEENANFDLLYCNVEQIKKILNSIKESENNIKMKYNI